MDSLSNEKFLFLCGERVGDRSISEELYDQDKIKKQNILLTFLFIGLLDHSKANKPLLFLMYTWQSVRLAPDFPKGVIDMNEPQRIDRQVLKYADEEGDDVECHQ